MKQKGCLKSSLFLCMVLSLLFALSRISVAHYQFPCNEIIIGNKLNKI